MCITQYPLCVAQCPGYCTISWEFCAVTSLNNIQCTWSIGSMGCIGGADRTFTCKSQECLWQDWYIFIFTFRSICRVHSSDMPTVKWECGYMYWFGFTSLWTDMCMVIMNLVRVLYILWKEHKAGIFSILYFSLEARYSPQKNDRKIFPPLKLDCYSWPRCESLTFVAINRTTGYHFYICICKYVFGACGSGSGLARTV